MTSEITERNKEVVRRVNRGFAADDPAAILACLADDVRWMVVGHFLAVGKEEFRKRIRHENFTGAPTIEIKNEIAEGDCVAVEGRVSSRLKNGAPFQAYFHNSYRLENEKIKEMTSYVVPRA